MYYKYVPYLKSRTHRRPPLDHLLSGEDIECEDLFLGDVIGRCVMSVSIFS